MTTSRSRASSAPDARGRRRVGQDRRMTQPATTLTAAFQQTAERYPHNLALSTSDGSARITWRQYAAQVEKLAAGFAGLGVGRGDTVGIMLTNRPEFHLIDTATLHTGATPFSIYNTLAPEQIAHLFSNAGNKIVLCEQQFLDQIRAATAATDSAVKQIVCIDADVEGTLSLADLENGKAPRRFDFAKA